MEVYLLDGREIAITDAARVKCGGEPLGHPAEWLSLAPEGVARCKYCDRCFVLPGHPLAQRARQGERVEG